MVLIIGEGGPADGDSLQLYTRGRRRIENVMRRPRPPAAMLAARAAIEAACPQARMRTLDSRYNCMGLLFASRRTWIDPDQFFLIAEDDALRQLPRDTAPLPGDIAAYFAGGGPHAELIHVALVVGWTGPGHSTVDPELLSQFGADGEYFHHPSEIPSFLARPPLTVVYYTDRTNG